jgi:AcrR family transcriptional regulator
MARKTKEEVLGEYRCGSIQEAAMAVIARKGVADATMQDIADEAGIAKGTLYVYFRDRDELLAKTAAGAYDRLVAELDEALSEPGTLEQRLTRVALRQLRFFDQHRELFRAYMALTQQREGGAALRKPKLAAHARYLERLERLFAEARDSGELRELDPHEVASVYADCMRGMIVRRIEEKSKTPREDVAALVVSILLHGLHT